MNVCVKGVGVDTVGLQPRCVSFFKIIFREYSILLFFFTFFYVRSEHVRLPKSVCDVMGCERATGSKSQPLNTVKAAKLWITSVS